MYKRLLAGAIVLALVIFGVWWLGGDKTVSVPPAPVPVKERLNVTVSGYVAYSLAKQIGGDRVTLHMLVPPGTEPHSFEPTPGSIIAVNEADLFVYVSPRVEPWTADILKGLSGVNALEAGPSLPEQDPHVWMTPYGALEMAKRISKALIKADPEGKAYYKQNLRFFEEEIKELHASFMNGFADCQSRDVVHVGHLAFGNLARTYGLNLQSLTGTSHQSEHSVHRLAELVRYIRKHGVPAVFTEEMLSQDLADTVARETNVRVLPLYTVEEVSKKDFDAGITYGEYMRRNLHNLREGLKCRP